MRLDHLACALVALTITGCATTKITQLSDGKPVASWKSGIPVTVPDTWSQYLVVTKTKDGSSAAVVTLPVYPEEPNYAVKHRPGWGSHKTAFTMSSGILTGMDVASDSKGAETLAASGAVVAGAGSVASGYGAVLSGAGAVLSGQAALETALQGGTNPYTPVKKAVTAIESDLTTAAAAASDPLKTALNDAKAKVASAGSSFGGDFPTTLQAVPEIRADLAGADAALAGQCPDPAKAPGTTACLYRVRIKGATAALDKATATAFGYGTPEPTVEVYQLDPKTHTLTRILP